MSDAFDRMIGSFDSLYKEPNRRVGRGPTIEEIKKYGPNVPIPFLCNLNCMEAVNSECNCWCDGLLHGRFIK